MGKRRELDSRARKKTPVSNIHIVGIAYHSTLACMHVRSYCRYSVRVQSYSVRLFVLLIIMVLHMAVACERGSYLTTRGVYM